MAAIATHSKETQKEFRFIVTPFKNRNIEIEVKGIAIRGLLHQLNEFKILSMMFYETKFGIDIMPIIKSDLPDIYDSIMYLVKDKYADILTQ